MVRRDLALHGGPDRGGLAGVGHGDDQAPAPEDLAHGHGDGAARERRRGTGTIPRRAAGAGRPRRASPRYRASSTSKSAGGSLKARWPFSPMPAKHDVHLPAAQERVEAVELGLEIGARLPPARNGRDRAGARRTGPCRYRRKLAGWVSARPTYSSRWNAVTRDQSIPGSATRAVEGLELARARRDDDRALAPGGQRASDRFRAVGCGPAPEGGLVGENFDDHVTSRSLDSGRDLTAPAHVSPCFAPRH